MRDFKRNSRFGGRGSERFGGGNSGRFERRGSERPNRTFEMHEVTCDKCGKRCEVPFKPSGGKPVYCSDCFRNNEDFGQRTGGSNASSGELDQINKKLDKILKALKID